MKLHRKSYDCVDSRAGLVNWSHGSVIETLRNRLLEGISCDGLENANHRKLANLLNKEQSKKRHHEAVIP